MTSSTTFKKLVSIGAAMLLAVGGSLTSASPASAAEVTSISLGGGSSLQSSMQTFSLGAAGCNSYSGTIDLTDWQLTLSSGSQTLTGVTLLGYMIVGLSAPLTSGQTVTVTYTKNVSRVITCSNGDTVGSFTYTGTVAGGGGSGQFCNPTITVTALGWSEASLGTSGTVRTIFNNDPSIGTSTVCYASMVDMAILSTLNGSVVGTPARYPTYGMSVNSNTMTLAGLLGGSTLTGVTVSDGDVLTTNYYISLGRIPTLSDTPTFSRSLILNPGVGGSSVVSTPRLSAEQARNVLKPVPAAVQPLVPGFLALNKPMASLGGKVALSAGDFTGLVSAKIAGKSLDFILGKTGQITMTVPQGEAGKTADLVLTFNTGSIILQDAIKYVAPVVVAEVPARPISISSSSKLISEEAQSEIRQAAFANVKNTAVACVGYASANDASARAAALALATKACAIANKANSDLAITGINVVVDKLKARTQGVGIKVYKANN